MVDTDVSDRRGQWPFTDCVLIGTDGRGTGAYASAKALSTKDDPVDGVDATQSVISSRDHPIVGDIPASGRAYFCVSVAADAKGYKFAVLSADWGFTDGP